MHGGDGGGSFGGHHGGGFGGHHHGGVNTQHHDDGSTAFVPVGAGRGGRPGRRSKLPFVLYLVFFFGILTMLLLGSR